MLGSILGSEQTPEGEPTSSTETYSNDEPFILKAAKQQAERVVEFEKMNAKMMADLKTEKGFRDEVLSTWTDSKLSPLESLEVMDAVLSQYPEQRLSSDNMDGAEMERQSVHLRGAAAQAEETLLTKIEASLQSMLSIFNEQITSATLVEKMSTLHGHVTGIMMDEDDVTFADTQLATLLTKLTGENTLYPSVDIGTIKIDRAGKLKTMWVTAADGTWYLHYTRVSKYQGNLRYAGRIKLESCTITKVDDETITLTGPFVGEMDGKSEKFKFEDTGKRDAFSTTQVIAKLV